MKPRTLTTTDYDELETPGRGRPTRLPCCSKDFGKDCRVTRPSSGTKKTEICLAKLANLAALEEDSKLLNVAKRQSPASFDDSISIIDVHEALCAYVARVTRNAIDVTAALEIALDILGKCLVESKPW